MAPETTIKESSTSTLDVKLASLTPPALIYCPKCGMKGYGTKTKTLKDGSTFTATMCDICKYIDTSTMKHLNTSS